MPVLYNCRKDLLEVSEEGGVSQHIRRIELLEKELKALTKNAAGKDDVSRVRAEMKKLYDGLHIELLDLMYGEFDLHALSKKEATSIQVSE
ncbi:hypothetical protein Clacol_007548 [Clathrus columnatus]|uniref:Uncharacterized protein n=1 Tax=Clathrus columnatus TaxID=1419009 RepID=A0AAV5ALH2_9AGAM|nr:hypothetical protein Clacol_007548 [Clathrus columnatus]